MSDKVRKEKAMNEHVLQRQAKYSPSALDYSSMALHAGRGRTMAMSPLTAEVAVKAAESSVGSGYCLFSRRKIENLFK